MGSEMCIRDRIYSLRHRFCDDRSLVELLDDFQERRLFKRCYMISRRIGEDEAQRVVRRYHLNENGARDEAEGRIAEALGVPVHHVALYCAPPGMALKEADVPVTMPGGKMDNLSAFNSEEIRVLKDQHRALWRLYVFVSPRVKVGLGAAGRAGEDVIGYPNELPAQRR